MADKCAICGANINLIQTQKLADGNCICRKNCRKKGFKAYDYVHGNLQGVKAHLTQVERGTNMKGKLKTVRFQPAANSYMKAGSMNITESRDMFLYNTVTRTAKPKANDSDSEGSSTHTSSSGSTHGGGGGSF